MTQEQAIAQLLSAYEYFEQHSEGYKTWGKVTVLQIAIRLENGNILVTDRNKLLAQLTASDIHQEERNGFFGRLFSKRKNISIILYTHQEYASQVKTEIPPILDDQAQLLGVSVRIATEENKINDALCGRFAVILNNGNSICIGTNLEEAYVAAQLLEKTSKAFVEAAYLGGAKAINRVEAWLMHKFYMLKYSKEAKKNK
ncbi:MAG TPA: hypothetical protein PLK15_03720 [Chitinophagales bacterium]|jgi:L-fuculose-phosphate aldolase|nr:hypothetical protein [Chitinophagales bacterium]